MVDPGLSVGDKIRLDLEVAVKDAQSLLDLTKSLKDLAKTFRFVKDKGKELAETNKRLKKAQEDFNKVIKRAKGLKSALVQQTKIEVQATKELGSAFKKLRVEEEKAHKLAKAKFNLTRQQISANVALMRATKNIQKVENRRLTTAATQAEVDRKKLRLNAEELAQLGLKATAISREIAAKEQLALQNALLGEKETRNIRAQVLALKAKNAELDKQALRKARAAAGLPATDGVPSADRVKKSRGQVDKLNRSLKTTQSMGNRISFTFRRLFGILAAFTIARKLVQGFVESVKAAIKFNAQLEQSILGMASLIVSAGRIHTALGPAVTEAQNLALATQEARKQIELLRSDALQTAASFEDLIEAFQIAITPGLQAGLGLNEIRELTVRISQAAAAIALPQRQLAEEIRSLLQGTIRVRDTRIAVSLGITNDDIRRAKELGDLGGFLTRRFRAFALAGKQAEQNLSILFTNTKDALLLLAGRAGVDFFDSVKEILTSIKDSVVELNKVTGEIELDPEAMAVADTFFSALESAVREAIKLKDNLSSFQLEQIGSALSSTFSATMTILRVGLEVFIDAISIISVGLNAVFLVIKGIGKIFGIFAQEPAINKAISGLLKLMLALGLAIKITTAAWAIHKIVVKGVKAVYYTTLVGGRALVTMLKFMTLAVVGSTASFKALKVTLAPLLIPIAALLAKITAIALTALVAVSAVRLMLSADVEADAIEKLEELIRLREEELKLIRYAKSDLLDSADAIASQEREFGLLQDRIRRVVADLNKLGVSSEELDLVHAGTDPADVRNFVDRIVKDAKHLLSSLGKEMGDLASGLFGGKVGQSELEKIFENFPQAVSPINRALDQQRDKLKNLGEQLNEHITLSGLIAQNMGLGGEALEHRIAQAKTELDLKKTTLQLEAERTNAEKATDNALESKLNIQRRINKLSKEDQNIVAFGLNSLKVRKGITNQISLLEQKIATQYALKAKEREETERDRIDLVVKGLEEEIKKAEKLAEIERVMGDSFFDKIDDVEQRKFLAEIVEDQLQAEANLNAALSAREEILAAILTITKAIRAEAGAALAKEASTQTQTLKLQTAELELQLRHQKELTQFSTAFTETRVSEKTLVQARQAVELERQKLSVIDATRTIQEAQFLKWLLVFLLLQIVQR